MPSSINSQTFKLLEKSSTTKMTTAVTYDVIRSSATLDLINSLRSQVIYEAVVTTGAKDMAGNLLDQNPTATGLQQKAWSFTKCCLFGP
jgi:hypothetical protein